MLGYFGCDQSQVQRYLTGKSVAQSKLSMMFNAIAKVPMQFFILFVGAMVFVFYLFAQPPMLFQQTAMKAIATEPAYASVQSRYDNAWLQRERAAQALNAARRRDDKPALDASIGQFRSAQRDIESARESGIQLYRKSTHESGFNDTNSSF